MWDGRKTAWEMAEMIRRWEKSGKWLGRKNSRYKITIKSNN